MPYQSSDNQSDSQWETQEPKPSVQIDLTPEFQRNLRDLAKRYRHIRIDVQAVIQELELGSFLGDRLAGVGDGYVVLKVRVRNRDIQKGKSAGYRLIYQVEAPTCVLLLTIYAKSDREDIAVDEIRQILGEFYDAT